MWVWIFIIERNHKIAVVHVAVGWVSSAFLIDFFIGDRDDEWFEI